MQAKERQNSSSPTKEVGWICPICGTGNAPWSRECSCNSNTHKYQKYTPQFVPMPSWPYPNWTCKA